MSIAFYCFLVTLFILPELYMGFNIPSPYVEVLPRGFRVFIQDEPGISLFAFHGKMNKRFRANDEGEFRLDVLRPRNGVWVYENRTRQVMEGDILYYWIYVQHNNLGYFLDEQEYVFRNVPISAGTASKPTVSARTTTTTTTQRPRTPGTKTTMKSTTPTRRTTTTTTTTTTTPPPWTNNEDDTLECQPSMTTVKGKPVCRDELIFEENFNGNSLTKLWKNAVKMPLDTEDAEFVSYQNLASVCYVRDGYFNVFPKILADMPGFSADTIRTGTLDFGARCTAVVDTQAECKRMAQHFTILPPVVSCKIKTKQTFTFKYGKVEIRAKVPRGDWLYPHLNLEPIENAYGTSRYNSGLLRVAFVRGNENLKSKSGEPIDGSRLSGGGVLVSREKWRDLWMANTTQQSHFGEEFHTYELLWTNRSIELSVDGNPYGSIEGGFRNLARTNNVSVSSQLYAGEYMAPFDKEFFFSVGVGVGGISDFPDSSKNGYGNFNKPWTNTSPKAELNFWNDVANWNSTWDRTNSGLQVDYIKVWSI